MTQGATGIAVAAIDHVHLYVSSLADAATWYRRVLGLQVLPVSERLGDRGRYLATARGQYCATLFVGQPPSDGDHTTAFRVSGRVFLEFAEKLPALALANRSGGVLTRDEADDHGLAWSFYFTDPDGNHLELTTYDHARVRAVLGPPS